MGSSASEGSTFLQRMFGVEQDDGSLWQDKEIRFDNPVSHLKMRPGEVIIQDVEDVEDTKGNNGDKGNLLITNLRLLWVSAKQKRTNLSVGLNCMISSSIRNANSRLKGSTQALHCLTKFNGSRFEFIFTSLVRESPELFNILQTTLHQYEATRPYRDLKLRSNIISDKQLKLLSGEEMYNKISGVWNLSSEQGNLGTFFVTDVRLVWHANLAQNFNVSIPYIQMRNVSVRESKFGKALVIETMQRSGSYILGFKMEPNEKLMEASKEIQSLWQTFSAKPYFGADVYGLQDRRAVMTAEQLAAKLDEDVAIIETDVGDSLSAYFADGGRQQDREPVFSAELGLAVEGLQDGMTVQQLWSVL
uniref:Bardet-Biedl syndrome 5 protein n=2 Tax=Tetraselmis sp. GSL018 TaxID=582737 RepID=A0A061RW20_9CHLO